MVTVQLVTVHGCPEARCDHCEAAEQTLRAVAKLVNIELPKHRHDRGGEVHMDDGTQLEIWHTTCEAAQKRGLDPKLAPYLLVDGHIAMEGAEWDPDILARIVIDAIKPGGFGDVTA